MSGKGVLAIWNDCVQSEENNYENWYQNEHLPERLGVPGFIRGRRYQSLVSSPRFFTWYEVASPSTLTSESYMARLSDPTPWTQEIMANVFLNASRTVCDRHIISGQVFGSTALTIQMSETRPKETMLSILENDKNPSRIARIENWTANTAFDTNVMAEESIRGPDKKIASCLFIETLRREHAVNIAEKFREQFHDMTINVYDLLCERN